MMNRKPDVEAEVTFLSTEEGGRKTPIVSGYRPNHLIKPDYLTSGQHEYLDVNQVFPGQTVCANIWFITPPTGYVRRPSGDVMKDPDERVQTVIE